MCTYSTPFTFLLYLFVYLTRLPLKSFLILLTASMIKLLFSMNLAWTLNNISIFKKAVAQEQTICRENSSHKTKMHNWTCITPWIEGWFLRQRALTPHQCPGDIQHNVLRTIILTKFSCLYEWILCIFRVREFPKHQW